ncbi:protein nervous wreck isoform X5 [Cherax quadricarinatus]|uniref:protein nervous wreck isoform X5 n=1 Tax=Cherax quadricarinatus TaxID=27406 RepID=UPI00387ECECA
MQPPPRKGNYLKVCKNLHSEQLSKLLAKNQQECDLLEDIRNFTKQRSTIEKNYGEALCKIAANYQNRKIACVPDIRLEDGSEAWNVYSVWRTVLDETEKLGKARLAAVEVFQQNISEDAKQTRLNKIHLGKKFADQLKVIQNELQTQIQDLDRTKKVYYDEEHVAHDAREKASAAEEKCGQHTTAAHTCVPLTLKRKKGSIFQSIQSLQKNSAKFSAKRDVCDEKSAGARNDYIISLAAANAHQRRYYEIDFERFLRTMECEMYDKVSEYLTLMSRAELLTCSASQSSFNKIKEQATTVTRGYNLRCYLTFYPMLGQNIQYEFEPCESDQIDKITIHDETTQNILESESKKCVATVQKEVKVIREASKKIQKLGVGGRPETDLPPDVEIKLDELRNIIRKAETRKAKAEAKLEVMKEGGIEVEDYTKSVDSDSLGVDLDTSLSRSGSMLSVREEMEAGVADYDGDQAETDTVTSASAAEPISVDSEKEDYTQSQDSGKLEPTSWDPISVDWGDAPASPLPPMSNGPPEDQTAYPKCTVLYNYTAQNPDELTIVENEELEVMGEGDGDGWVQARNYKGEVGFIPQNYIEMEEGGMQGANADFATFPEPGAEDSMAGEATTHTTANGAPQRGISFSSIEYNLESVEEYPGGEMYPSEPPGDLPPPPPPAADSEDQMSVPRLSLPIDGGQHSLRDHCCALYDYEATCPEEISFSEGQIIKILKRSVHDVDDGWWEGQVGDQIGLFPSLVVEECHSDGEPLTPDVFTFQAVSGASPCTTPPPHTPPEVPGFLLPPERVIITQPTPVAESAEDDESQEQTDGTAATSSYEPPNFELELSGTQQEQYSRQFSSSPESETTEKDEQYAELISSPDVSNQEAADQTTQREEKQPSTTTSPDVAEEGCELTRAHVVEVCEPPGSPPLSEPSQQGGEVEGQELEHPAVTPPVSPPQGGEVESQELEQVEHPAVTPPVSPPQGGEVESQELEHPAVTPPVSPLKLGEEVSQRLPQVENPTERALPKVEEPPPPPPPPPPQPQAPEPPKVEEPVEVAQQGVAGKRSSSKKKRSKLPFEEGSSGDGLGVAQIIITAATPMVEKHEEEIGGAGEDSRAEADQDPLDSQHPEAERSECEGEALVLDDEGRQPPPPPAPEGPMEMRMEMVGAEGGAGDLEGEQIPSPKSPSPSDGPPELDPEKLKALERIKESNA